jgi:hypothetical protein
MTKLVASVNVTVSRNLLAGGCIAMVILLVAVAWLLRSRYNRGMFDGLGGFIEGFDDQDGNTDPSGIPGSQIPAGDESLYILKSQVVPPVCPACPSISACPRTEAPPPCPACERCPEPAFDCKKVPNYQNGPGNLPAPVVTDFSTFGM